MAISYYDKYGGVSGLLGKLQFDSGPARDNNKMKQSVNNVSEVENPNDYNQQNLVKEQADSLKPSEGSESMSALPLQSQQTPYTTLSSQSMSELPLQSGIGALGDIETSGWYPSTSLDNAEDSLVNEINTNNQVMQNVSSPTSGMESTARFEGTVPNVYTDTGGIPHYGVGHKMTSEEIDEFGLGDYDFQPNQQLRDYKVDTSRIQDVFQSDYSSAQDSARNILNLSNEDYSNMPEDMRNMVTDMTFNMGAGGMSKFPKFLDAIKGGRYGEAAGQLRYSQPYQTDTGEWTGDEESAYYGQTGQRSAAHYKNLLNR